MKSNYDKNPVIHINSADEVWEGWSEILKEIEKQINQLPGNRHIVVLETYPGVNDQEILSALEQKLSPALILQMKDFYKSSEDIAKMSYGDVTEDRIFGFKTRLNIQDFIDPNKIEVAKKNMHHQDGLIIIYGTGTTVLAPKPDILIYADMARWEIQQRMRANAVCNLGRENFDLEISRKYKIAYFVDWRVADRIKRKLYDHWDFYLDTNKRNNPKMVAGDAIRLAFQKSVEQPFRVVPFFDPGPWGGQWMKEVCDLDKSEINYAWCFDCVPEENSVLYNFNGVIIESPSQNIVFYKPKQLLGENTFSRFGAEFPIRFDFLDTIDGGNLSLQVHPLTEYIREHFGLCYTQDESYYMLDVKDQAFVYLGLKKGIDPNAMIEDLQYAQDSGEAFDADKYVAKWPVKKHDHVSIPAGTVHCSGKDSMVLEISATPYIFTFKLYDWGRLGLDGLPRPINIKRGAENIQWERTEDWVKKELINPIEVIHQSDGIREEKTGLHQTEFIETRRHWFTKPVLHDTNGCVNVLNLVEGREAIIESPENEFEPLIVHYAETFIMPAQIGKYTIRPYGESEGKQCATIKAYVRT